MRAADPAIPSGGSPAQTLCPATCKAKRCARKPAHGRAAACDALPCQNGGQCADSTTDAALPAGTHKCTCAFDRWYGDNCETSEDDCVAVGGTQTCGNEGETCTDCARQIANPIPGGYPVSNPDCPQVCNVRD
jgi:hypothetical protein